MKFATIAPKNAPFNPAHRKERRFYRAVTVVCTDQNENAFKPFEARFYKTANSVACVVWFHLPKTDRTHKVYTEHVGSARASGAGYNKENAALVEALYNAGLQIEEGPDVIKIAEAFTHHFWPWSFVTIVDSHA